MKNSYVVLLSSLFVSSFSLGMMPDPCYLFIDPFAWATCKVTSSIVWKVASAAAGTAASTAAAAAPAVAGVSTSTKIVVAAAALSSVVPDNKPAAVASKVVAPVPAKREEQKPVPAPSSPQRSTITHRHVAAAAAGGFTVGAILVPPLKAGMDAAIRRGVDEIADEITGKKAKQDKQREEEMALQKEALDIQRKSVAAQEAAVELQRKVHAEDMVMHLRASEQNEKVLAQGQKLERGMGSLSKQMAEFAGAE